SRYGGHGLERLGLLAAAAPSFTQREGFPFGKTRAEVDQILANLYRDRPQTIAAFAENFFASQVSAPFRSWFQTMSLTPSLHSTAATLVSLRDEDLRGDLGRVRVPTGIFHGALDKICPFPLAEAMHRGIAGSALYRFERSGHGIFYDELELFNRRLLNFLNGTPVT
ncbi:alpha/beta fold hydrolase, partial [Paenibacillus kobensis]|uniref:alpha/beta fold hydrolase n=1 Tax=Paenibacillus kobensis TaxID=59841 RepID=UPI0013E33328